MRNRRRRKFARALPAAGMRHVLADGVDASASVNNSIPGQADNSTSDFFSTLPLGCGGTASSVEKMT